MYTTTPYRSTSKLCWQTCQSQTARWHLHSCSRAVPNSSADTSPAGKGMWASTINLPTQDMDDIDMKNSSSHHPSRASQPWVRFAAESGLWEKKMLLFERTSLQLSLARCSTGKSWKRFLPGNYCWTPPVLDQKEPCFNHFSVCFYINQTWPQSPTVLVGIGLCRELKPTQAPSCQNVLTARCRTTQALCAVANTELGRN